MKDILLKRTSIGTYDWDFMFDDVRICNGNKQLIQAVKHAVLLRPDELAPEIYEGKGCPVHDLIKQPETETRREEMRETVEHTVQKVHGVSTVQAHITEVPEYSTGVQLTLINDNKEVITIHEI
jgi:hypothetical protein